MERLQLSGELTIYRAQALKGELLAAVSRCSDLEVDLGGVAEIDTSAVQLLLLAKREMAAKGGRLALTNHSAPVVQALDLYGLAPHFGDPVLLRERAGG